MRSIDHPVNGGWGLGKVELLFSELEEGLRRSERSVYRYLKDALTKGFIHSYRVRCGVVKIRYCSLERVASRLGLERIGAVASFPLEDIEFAKVRCTEAQALSLQNQSWHEMRKEWGKFAVQTQRPEKLLTSDKVAGGPTFGRGKRLIYLRSRQRAFGGSQDAIADRLGVSLRTVQYRLSDQWRESRGLNRANKAQAAREICEEYPLEMLKDFYDFCPNRKAKLVFMGRRLFEVSTNLYYFEDVSLRSQRYRKSKFLRMIGASSVSSVTQTENRSRPEGIRRDVKILSGKIKTGKSG